MRVRATERRGFFTASPLPIATSNDEEPKGKGGGDKKGLTALLKDNDELQEEFDEIIEKRVARERRKLGGGNGRRKEDDETAQELETLRAFKATQEQTEAERKGEYEKALNAERERFGTKEGTWKKRESTLVTELRKERVRGRLVAAAAKAGAVDPNDVAEMLERRVDLDDDFNPFIRHEKDPSKRAINGEGDDLTLDELVEDFLSKKPHMARAGEGDGAGAKGGASSSAEGAARKVGKENADIAALRKQFEDAKALATTSPSAAHLTKMQQAARRLKDAEKKVA